jgi:hypothetical protein
LRSLREIDGSFAAREMKLDGCGWSYEGKGRDVDEGRVAGERRPSFDFMMELIASPRQLFNGSLAVGDGCKGVVDCVR